MSKKTKTILFIMIGIVLSIALVFGIVSLVQYIRIKTAKIEVSLVEDLTIEFADKKKYRILLQVLMVL